MASTSRFAKPTDPDLACWQAIVDGGNKYEWGCAQLYLRYHEQLKRMISRSDLSDSDVEELVQDVFVNMIKGAATFVPDRKFKIWLLAIAHNTLADYLNKTGRAMEVDWDDEAIQARLEELGYVPKNRHDEPANALVNCVQEAFEAFDLLYPERAFVIQAVVLEGCSYKEVARMIGREVGATGEYISQCKKKFKPFLKRCQIYLFGDS